MGSVGQMGAYAPVFKKEGKKNSPAGLLFCL